MQQEKRNFLCDMTSQKNKKRNQETRYDTTFPSQKIFT
jgi:hypothetical protein